jgi:hypothetical protein
MLDELRDQFNTLPLDLEGLTVVDQLQDFRDDIVLILHDNILTLFALPRLYLNKLSKDT